MYILQHSCCGELEIMGIYDSMEAASLQCQVMSHNDVDGERFWISYFNVESKEQVQQRLERVKLNRTLHNS